MTSRDLRANSDSDRLVAFNEGNRVLPAKLGLKVKVEKSR
jgi:hypothetical protein